MPPVPPTERARGAPRHRVLYPVFAFVAACTRATPFEAPHRAEPAAADAPRPVALAGPSDAAVDDAPEAVPAPWSPDIAAVDGPHTLPWESGRPVWWAVPHADAGRHRLVGHLHGMCGPPSYACGRWVSAGTSFGAMVCPTGNARCGDQETGPPSWEAPSWPELVTIMDRDLETAITKVGGKTPLDRDDAILTGYSRGGFAVPVIARRHPGRWPYLVIIEANAPLTPSELRASGVRAVALVAGEYGTERAGMGRTAATLTEAGVPATLVVMPKTAHPYPDDLERVMWQALTFVVEHGSLPP